MHYVHNDIVKTFKVKILHYADCVREMHDLEKYLLPISMKGESVEAANWVIRNQYLTAGKVWREIKDGLPKYIQDELEDHPEDYRSLTYEYWCDILPTIKGKDENKSAAAQTKNIDSARAAYLSGVEYSSKIQRKKKSRTGILWSNKPQKKAHKNHSIQRYCVLFTRFHNM